MAGKILLAATLLVALCGCASDDGADAAERAALAHSRTESDDRPVVLFLGTSLTAGYGLGAEQAYPSLIQARMDSVGYPFRIVNAGESGGTSAGGVRRIDWLLRQPISVLVLELGANDGLRGQDLDALRANLETIVDVTRRTHPDVEIVLAGMEAPRNLGSAYTGRFRQIFVDVAREKDAVLIPFLLEGVAGHAELNQADGIHPTAAGQQRLAENVWEVLEPILARLSSGRMP